MNLPKDIKNALVKKRRFLTKAQKFVAHNKTVLIIAGEWLTSKKKTIRTAVDHDDRTYLRYKFEDGSVRTLTKDDVRELKEAPEWKVVV